LALATGKRRRLFVQKKQIAVIPRRGGAFFN
jgi:hypothetical protein